MSEPNVHPIFAIVGHPNKGKSSIVATLAEDEFVAISPDPGTTGMARSFRMRINEQVLYELVDTPGFQRPRAILEWLRQHERGADARPQVVRDFVAAHAESGRFQNEVELLKPILAGAGVLYVVDGAHPYGPEYEPEMEVLRWTGRPRMALINLIGTGDYVDDWRRALNQYFSIVRVFDAQRADFSKRLELLRAFRELGEGDDLSQRIGSIKGATARRLGQLHPELGPVWANGFHDRALRHENEVRAAARYLVLNPVRAGLVRSAAQYPYWDAVWVGGARG